jgi:hypothetical protein
VSNEVGLDDELHEALRTLLEEVGALSARITEHDEQRSGVPARTIALGGGEYLRVELGTRTTHEHDVEAAFERAVRQLRAIRRRWEATRLPEVAVTASAAPPRGDRIVAQMEAFLRGLASLDRVSNAIVTRSTQLVAAARPPDELEGSRWPFLARRALATHAPGSSHGEVVDPDAYAMSFWYDAALIVLLVEPYGVDFVRHRCRQVARELANLLPMLEPDPDAPVAIRRRPPENP